MFRRTAPLFFAALFLSATASAQGRMDPEAMRERMTAQIGETITALELTGDRAETVRVILMSQAEKRLKVMQEFRERRRGQAQQGQQGRSGMREMMQAHDAETHEMLAEVLTEDELTRFVELENARRPGRRGPGRVQ